MTDCIFCGIAQGRIPARVAGESAHALAFHDLAPQAPVHILVVPKTHLTSAAEASGDAGEMLLGQVMRLGVEVAASLGLDKAGYRFVMNTGQEGGQTVGHLHLHLLGGRAMHWPPG